MELMSLEELISSGRVFVLLGVIVIVAFAIRWFINEANGTNYYNKYPVAKAMDEMAASGELKDKDIMDAMSNIDYVASKKGQSEQFKTNIRSQS